MCCTWLQPQTAPVLSAEKNVRREKPLDFLVERFAVDPSTQWRRLYALGGQSEMLVVVRQEHGDREIHVDFFTDTPSELVLHWGVCNLGKTIGMGIQGYGAAGHVKELQQQCFLFDTVLNCGVWRGYH